MLKFCAKAFEVVGIPAEDVVALQIEMNSFPDLLMVGVPREMICTGCENEVRLLAKSHGVADLQVDVGALVGQFGDDDLAALDELDDLAFEQVALVMAIHAARLETGCLEGGKDHFVAESIKVVIADLHYDEAFRHANLPQSSPARSR
jgi:hypothetical protein